MLCWTPGLWTGPAVRERDVLRRQPLDPQPEDVHPDGKPGRRVPSLEPQGEYLTGGSCGAGGVSWAVCHTAQNLYVVERQGNFPFLTISSHLHLYGSSSEGAYVRECITVRIMPKRIRGWKHYTLPRLFSYYFVVAALFCYVIQNSVSSSQAQPCQSLPVRAGTQQVPPTPVAVGKMLSQA